MVSITLKDLANSFARQKLVNASVLVLNKVDYIDGPSVNLIQSLLGRDAITYSQKHQQGEYEFTFKGIILISTNANPSKLFRNCSALVDRFVLITHVPRNGEADPTLENTLLEESV